MIKVVLLNFISLRLMLLVIGGGIYSYPMMNVFANDYQQDNQGNNMNTIIDYHRPDNVTNQIPYFDNRFRLDADLDEVTLIFYRKSGSKPIILIRPDGSKIRVNDFDSDKVEWFDDPTFDMIKIKQPMPGPWQAVGNILPNSHIVIVSEVIIAANPLPKVVFSGETLKIEGHLYNGNKVIKNRHFKEAVSLDVNFYATNNTAYDNFGADAVQVNSFRDDGYGLDEYVDDNTFTGEFVLNFPPGEWTPVYVVKLPMLTRELMQSPILLKPPPISLSVIPSKALNEPHQLVVTIDSSLVLSESIIFQGNFTLPDRQVEPFSVMEKESNNRRIEIHNTASGLYKVNLSAFGETINGREFRLVMPEFSFNVEPLDNLSTPPDLSSPNNLISDIKVNPSNSIEEQEQEQEQEQEIETLTIIVAANLMILSLGLFFLLVLNRKKIVASHH